VTNRRLAHELLHYTMGTMRFADSKEKDDDYFPTVEFPFTPPEQVETLFKNVGVTRYQIGQFGKLGNEVPDCSLEKVKHHFAIIFGIGLFPITHLRRKRPGGKRITATSYWNHYANEYVCNVVEGQV
jgi:hypothetical protein